jgi:hypothetical protein
VAIEEEEGTEGLVLGGGGDVFFDGEVGEEGFDFGDAHVSGVPFVMEEDVAAYPLDVGLFGLVGVVFKSEGVADLVEEFFGWGFHGDLCSVWLVY